MSAAWLGAASGFNEDSGCSFDHSCRVICGDGPAAGGLFDVRP